MKNGAGHTVSLIFLCIYPYFGYFCMYMKLRSILVRAAALLGVCCLFVATSCGEDEPDPSSSAPVLVSTDPADGLADYEGSSLTVKFTFDSAVTLSERGLSRIAVGEATVTDVVALGRYVTVSVGELKPGKSYTILIPEGALYSLASPEVAAKAASFSFSTKPEPEKPPVPTDWESASAAVAAMRTGWNLGNTLDAHSFDWKSTTPGWIVQYTDGRTSDWETAWGQPVTKPELLKMFADAGFGAIRVPVTWAEHFGPDGNIDAAWMDRVEQVVRYVLNTGMYCILNVHHDTGEVGWLHCDDATYKSVNKKFSSLWTQIATRFADYGDHLLFESFNEMLDGNNRWNTTSAVGYENINKYNADFVRAVRATGGNNGTRNLVVNTYAASCAIDAMNNLILPKDTVEGHLIAQVHSYAPYRFAFEMENPADQLTVFDAACEAEVRGIVESVNECFVKKGIPAIIGEYGATSKLKEEEMAKQAACYVSTARKYGIACFYWMVLSDGGDRNKPAWSKPLLKDTILAAYKGE